MQVIPLQQISPVLLDGYLAAIAKADRQALADLYAETSAGVYAYALSTLKNSHDAEDVLHDCYLQIWNNAGSYRSQGKPAAWILTIARNLCFKVLRDKARYAQLDTEDWRDHVELCTEMTADDKVVLEQCMERLSDDERQIVVLHAVAGFKHKQIAQLMELALPTVLSKYHRALKKLRDQL